MANEPLEGYSSLVNVRRGDVYWIRVPASDGKEPEYAHPHVIIQDDVFNRSRIETVIVCALTSNKKRASEPGNVLLDEGEGSLKKQSILVVSQVSTIRKTDLGERIGCLSQNRVDQVLAGLRFQQASFFRDE